MYDTIIATMELDKALDPMWFKHYRHVSDPRGGIVRRWSNLPGDVAVTHYAFDGDTGGRITVQFSVPHVLKMDRRANPTTADAQSACDRVDELLADLPVSNITSWRARRIDYAWNWEVSPMAAYLDVVQSLRCGTMARNVFPQQGVNWKSSSSSGKTIKFYDKSKQIGDGDERSALRFEVSNYAQQTSYICKNWFGCDQTVENVLQPGRALYVLASAWSKLGLHQPSAWSSGASSKLLIDLRSTFGASAAQAFYVLALYKQYGNKATSSDLGLVSRSTYYTYVSRLREHGYLIDHTHALSPLTLPIQEQSVRWQPELARLLKISEVGEPNLIKKISWENVRYLLGLGNSAPKIPFLLESISDYQPA